MQITFWGTEYFKNIFDKEVPFGTKLKYPIVRQISFTEQQEYEEQVGYADFALYAILGVFLLLALCGGHLLSTWMFLNSMQLLFHVPLIKTDLPAHAHFFMVEYLKKLRLSFVWTEEL